uniref:Uncharacterized protein n=1 Tax=Anguilla anguilla TaxID=7936 RepID=A0A0E9RIU2_ANGAN
MVTTVWRQ